MRELKVEEMDAYINLLDKDYLTQIEYKFLAKSKLTARVAMLIKLAYHDIIELQTITGEIYEIWVERFPKC